MGLHYEPRTEEEKKRKRKRQKKEREAVKNIMKQNPKEEVEDFIKGEGRVGIKQIQDFIIQKYINKDWLHDLADPSYVARKAFSRIKDSYRGKYNPNPDKRMIKKNTDVYYTFEEVDPE